MYFTRLLFFLCLYYGSGSCSLCEENAATQVNCTFSVRSERNPICGYYHHDDVGLYWERTYGGRSYWALTIDPTEDERVHYLWTDITSPQLKLEGPVCITFQYINQVCRTGLRSAFKLYVKRNKEKIFLREYYCTNATAPKSPSTFSMSRTWLTEELQFIAQPNDRLIFSGMQHGAYHEDRWVRLDDVNAFSGQCPGQFPGVPHAGDCDFESHDLCGYVHELNPERRDNAKWRVVRKENLYDKEEDTFAAPNGYFLAITPESVAGDMRRSSYVGESVAAITSPMIQMEKPGCLTFKYRNAPSLRYSNKALSVIFQVTLSEPKMEGEPEPDVYEEREMPLTFGDGVWATAFLDLTPGEFNVTFKSHTYSGFENYVGIDSVEFHALECEEVRCMPDPCEVYNIEEVCPHTHLDPKCVNHGKKFITCCDRLKYRPTAERETRDN